VGGGTAGLTLATRLSQKFADDCILVIEAGPDGRNEPGINIPGKRGSTFGSKYDWNFTTVPQTHVANRTFHLPRGHVLGGSSALNLMAWDRGSKADYDAWEELGNPGWNWENMYRSMLSVENFTSSPDYGSEGVAKGGIIQTLINRLRPEAAAAFIPAMERLSLEANLESLNGNPIGVARQPTNLREEDYSRSYSTRFLEHANDNIFLKLETRVAKININEHKKAVGITLEDGTTFRTTKEVILCTGAFQSPGLLEHSGIGNREILTKAGIETLYNLPGVGENHQDHVRVQASFILRPGILSFDRLTYNATYAAEQLALWYANETSEYDATAGAFAFMPWASVSGNLSANILSLAQQSVNNSSSITLRKQLQHLSDNSVPQLELILSNGYGGAKGYPKPSDPLYGAEMFAISGGIMHPFSRGSIHISSVNISVPPILNPNYLSSPVEFAALLAVAKYIRQIASTPPLADLWTSEYEPGAAVQSDEEWGNYVRTIFSSFDHPIGTCSMLPEKDGGVVSSELKVYGVEGLRVVDASIIPLAVSGHIQTAVYGIAERAAELVIWDWE